MKKGRRNILFFFILLLIVVVLTIIRTPFFISTEKIYYIPEIDMYIKVIKPAMDRYGYIYLSQNDILDSSDLTDLDHIKVWKSETADISILIDPNNRRKVYLCDRFNFATFTPSKFKIEKIHFLDKEFFLEETHMHRTIVKHPYIDIIIDNYLDSVYVMKHNGRSFNSIKTVN